jgi:hypothetical protein
MTADTVPRRGTLSNKRGVLMLPFVVVVVVLVAGAGTLVSYLLWPTWPGVPVPLDAPSIPVTVAGVLFDVPPAAIRPSVQRHPGPHERLDLAFMWPSLDPPEQDAKPQVANPEAEIDANPAKDRLFVTIAGLGSVLPPIERMRSIYPRYIASAATAGPDGLAILPFRPGTPYEGEDIAYDGAAPETFFARCTRPGRTVPGTCISERALNAAAITLRFPREWLSDWRGVAAGFDRLIAQLHPPGK